MREGENEWARGWPVLLAGAIGIGAGLAMYQYVASIFVIPLQEEFGWSRGQIAIAKTFALPAAFAAPIIGRLVDRFGVRPAALTALSAFSLSFVGLAFMPGQLWVYYLLIGVLVLSGLGTTGLTFSRAVASWFDKNRGLALALCFCGVSISAFVLPHVINSVIETYGWRAGYLTLAAIPAFIALPVAALLLRESPKEKVDAGPGAAAAPRPSFVSLLRQWQLYPLLIAIVFLNAASAGLLGQIQPLLINAGADLGSAAWLLSCFAIAVLFGRLGTGFLIDRFWAPGVGAVSMILAATGNIILAMHEPGLALLAIAILLIGTAQGAELDLLAYIFTRYFGLGAYATMYGVALMAVQIANASGAYLFGHVFDITGGYSVALYIASGFLVAAAAAFLTLGPYPGQPAPKDQADTDAAPEPTRAQ